jgi:hypothetical protein
MASLISLFTFAASVSLLEEIIKFPFTDVKCPLVFQCVSAIPIIECFEPLFQQFVVFQVH